MLRTLKAELLKAQWPLLLGLVIAGPALATILGGGNVPEARTKWDLFYTLATLRYAWLFYPLLAGVFAALVCRTEHVGGGWKQMLSLPVSRTQVYLAKYTLVAGLLALSNLVFVAVFVAEGTLLKFGTPVPWEMFARSATAGWLAVLPLAALQLAVSTRWKSFGAALALNVCFTLPAIFAAQSDKIGPWYPWAQPVLGMMPKIGEAGQRLLNFSPTTLWVVIVGGLAVTLAGGLGVFVRSDVRG